MNLWLHPATQRRLDVLIDNLPQSLLLSGEPGVGLGTIAVNIAGRELAATIKPTDAKGEVDDFGTINVETIRDLYGHTRTKQRARQIIVIDNAERMSRGAQSAFLKLLEEPNTATHFILTSHEPNILLPTIRSRVQHVVLRPITPQQTEDFIATQNVVDEKKKTQLRFIAAGLPAEIIRLLSNPAHFEAKAKVITDARIFLQADIYQKMKLIHTYRSNRAETLQLLDGVMAIIKHGLAFKPQPTLITQLDKVLQAKERIAANHSIPLTLAQAVL